MVFNKVDGATHHGQSACAALWIALGLTFRQEALQSSLTVKTDAVGEKHMPLDYDVFFGYRPEGDFGLDSGSRQNSRQHMRHTISDRFEFRFGNVLGYGQGVLQNISVSGAAIGVHRKLSIDQSIVMMVNSPDPKKLPIAVRLTIVRDAGATDDGLHCYGCRIDCVSDPNSDV